MKLYLVRHGEALPRDADPQRGLSDQGRREVAGVAALLARAGVGVRRIVHSGKKRARETAELFAEALAVGDAVEEAARGLAPDDATDKFADAVAGWRDDAMLVGHLPHMERLAARLLTGDEAAAITTFGAGTVVCLERIGDNWAIAWMTGPELLGE